ncbi:Arabinogalactan peptide 20 [Platanthera guangdongensis]|uniref:Arabinogalactan peptide 20 n=1 Tax=Platanthera guangdongensis TaxID=2320717 RepID=A0ABR2ME80_9ASPA
MEGYFRRAKKMVCFKSWALLFVAFFLPGLAQTINGQAATPAASPQMSNDGTAIDQGIAYLLMLAALIVTYLIH